MRAVLFVSLVAAACSSPQGTTPTSNPVPNVPATPSTPTPPDKGANNNAASGLYALTLTIGPECTGVPESERTRKYSARLSDDGPERYMVTLGDAIFFPSCFPLKCNQFRAVEEADTIRFSLSDEWLGGHITEQATSGPWLEISGEAVGRDIPRSSRRPALALCITARPWGSRAAPQSSANPP